MILRAFKATQASAEFPGALLVRCSPKFLVPGPDMWATKILGGLPYQPSPKPAAQNYRDMSGVLGGLGIGTISRRSTCLATLVEFPGPLEGALTSHVAT